MIKKMKKTSFDLPSHLSQVERGSKKILQALKSKRLSHEEKFDIRLCAEESLINAIKHGNGQKKGKVHVDISFDDKKVSIQITDEGKEAFDPSSVPDCTLPENIFKSHGRGVHLIRQLMDEVHFSRTHNKNQIQMIKYWGRKQNGY